MINKRKRKKKEQGIRRRMWKGDGRGLKGEYSIQKIM
jgi:hypothetical protein